MMMISAEICGNLKFNKGCKMTALVSHSNRRPNWYLDGQCCNLID